MRGSENYGFLSEGKEDFGGADLRMVDCWRKGLGVREDSFGCISMGPGHGSGDISFGLVIGTGGQAGTSECELRLQEEMVSLLGMPSIYAPWKESSWQASQKFVTIALAAFRTRGPKPRLPLLRLSPKLWLPYAHGQECAIREVPPPARAPVSVRCSK
jgi:hypothetical protein